MKYIILLGVLLSVTACANFSVTNPYGYGDYSYDSSSCCYEGNQPRP